jgi:hypothetical protein
VTNAFRFLERIPSFRIAALELFVSMVLGEEAEDQQQNGGDESYADEDDAREDVAWLAALRV